MSTPGANLHRSIMLACGVGDVRLFRNNTAMGWAGVARRINGDNVIISDARPLHAGLVKGSSDLIGWRSIVVTPSLVGKRLALFTAIEAKAGRDRLSPEQRQFLENVINAGGIAGEARSVEDAAAILRAIG